MRMKPPTMPKKPLAIISQGRVLKISSMKYPTKNPDITMALKVVPTLIKTKLAVFVPRFLLTITGVNYKLFSIYVQNYFI